MFGNTKKARNIQAGFVSLIVVSILAVVLGLVAIGFSKLMDRELGQSLNRELSAQAFYSALAGLDDARAYLGAGGTPFSTCDGWKNTALGPDYFSDNLSQTATQNNGIAKYSCVTIDTQPDNLSYQLNPDQSVTFEVTKASMSQMYFGWQNDSNPTSFTPLGSYGSLPQNTSAAVQNGSATGLLEVNLYPVPPGNPLCGGNSYSTDTNNTLACLSRTYYMYPDAGPGGTAGSIGYSSNGSFVHGYCKFNNSFQITGSTAPTQMCNSAITGLNSGWSYYVRLTARYERLNINFQAANAGSNLGSIPNAQAVVDVTGQGTNVLQRIRDRINLNNSFQTPLYGVQSMVSLCKGFDVDVEPGGQYGSSSNDNNISSYNVNNSSCAYPMNTSGTSISGSGPGELGPH